MMIVLLLALEASPSTQICTAAAWTHSSERMNAHSEHVLADRPLADTLIISLDQVKGFGPFYPSSGFLRELSGNNPWIAAIPEVSGVPDSLVGFRVYVQHMHFKQHAWQSWKAGLLDSSHVMDAFAAWGADTTRVTAQYLDLHVTIATGTDSRGQTRVIITPGTDLSGATAHILPDTAVTEPFPDRASMVVEPIRFELFDGDSVITAESWYRVSGPVPFGIPGETTPTLIHGTYAHRRADLHLGQDTVFVFLQNEFLDGSYDHQKALLFVGHPPAERPVTPDMLASVGEYVIIGGEHYRFDDVRIDGSEIRLVREPDIAAQTGTQPGLRAPELRGEVFVPVPENGDPGADGAAEFDLADMRGSWIFLDFWGTWCPPCIDEMPFLKEAWRLFRDDGFAMVGIAYDEAVALARFLDERDIDWPQILEEQGGANEILRTWGILGFPSTFLLDEEGIVRYRQLRHYELERKLADYIGFAGIAGDRLAEGEIVIRLDPEELMAQPQWPSDLAGAIEADVTIQSDFSLPGKTPLYKVNGEWVRGFHAEPGDYRYRLYVNGMFIPDPRNPRLVESEDGEKFNVVTVK
ncbi:MAG: redoxin domain-containing protein [Cyclonatronaceae bacterium]